MKNSLFLLIVISMLINFSVISHCQEKMADLKVSFNDKGISSIIHGGIELLDEKNYQPSTQFIRFPTADGKTEQLWAPAVKKQSFDADKKILSQEYEWGNITYSYKITDTEIKVQADIQNTTKKTISSMNIYPFKLLLPRNRQNLQGTRFTDGFGNITLLNYDQVNSAYYGTWIHEAPKDGKQLIPITMSLPEARIAKHPVVDNEKYFNTPGIQILPQGKITFNFSLVFGKTNSSIAELAPEYSKINTDSKQMALKWSDRRPIGTIFYCHSNTGWKTNPRGFNFGKADKNDITTPEGLKAFADALNAYGDGCLKNLKAMNAQGVIVWDLEGEEFWHPLSYIGDPRMLPQTAPEMDKLADEFLKKFTDAGIKIGVTIRPTEVYYREGQTPRFWHRDVKDPVELMSDKMAYAKKRWGATIFYLDSNVFGEGFDTKLPPASNVPWTMPLSMIQQLNERHPDCLVIPEWSTPDYYLFSAPYSSPNLRQLGTDPGLRVRYPDAFGVTAVNLQLMEDYWDIYLRNVQGGDVLLFPAWYTAPENTVVQLVYREADIRRQGLAGVLNKTEGDEVVRYYAATLLGKLESPESLSALIVMLDDPSPLVRKSALAALSKSKNLKDAALTDRLAAWLVKPSDTINGAMRPLVADVLGNIGEPAVPKLLEIMQGKSTQPLPYVYRALGITGTANEQVISLLLKPVEAAVGADSNQETVIKILGELKAKAAVPALINILKDNVRDHEFIRQQAVIALGKIGDKSAIEPLINEFKKGYSTVVVYSIEANIENALFALTGEKNMAGRNDWLKWWEKEKKLKIEN
jgi:HEAT repeat protein